MRLGELAKALGARLLGHDAEIEILGIEALYKAGLHDLSIFAWPKDIILAKRSLASALIMSSSDAADYADAIKAHIIIADDMPKIFTKLKAFLNQGFFNKYDFIGQTFIHPEAIISPQAQVGKAHIGAHTRIEAFAVVGDDVSIGAYSKIGPGVVILDKTRIGDHVKVSSHSVIGSDAFAPYDDNNKLIKLPSLGRVCIDNFVNIGALCTLDRGLLGATHIMKGSYLDNQVHVGHDVHIGAGVAICAQSALAGFVQVGEAATIGGQAGIAPHLTIGAKARVSAKTLVHKHLKAYEICSGNPGMPHERYLQTYKHNMKTNS